MTHMQKFCVSIFLSTLSLRRATRIRQRDELQNGNFYPRSPCGERHLPSSPMERNEYFYPRSPCGERRAPPYNLMINQKFLSTLSLRRATTHPVTVLIAVIISIHALLAESDLRLMFWPFRHCLFLSTLSLRRATLSHQHVS